MTPFVRITRADVSRPRDHPGLLLTVSPRRYGDAMRSSRLAVEPCLSPPSSSSCAYDPSCVRGRDVHPRFAAHGRFAVARSESRQSRPGTRRRRSRERVVDSCVAAPRGCRHLCDSTAWHHRVTPPYQTSHCATMPRHFAAPPHGTSRTTLWHAPPRGTVAWRHLTAPPRGDRGAGITA